MDSWPHLTSFLLFYLADWLDSVEGNPLGLDDFQHKCNLLMLISLFSSRYKKDKSTSINYNYAENHPSQVDCPQPNQASQPSKRAKMMLNAAMNPSQDIMKKEKKNLFTNTNNILQNKLSNFALASRNNLEKNINSLNANGSKNDRNHENINNSNNNNFLKKSTKIITKKYDCLICKNVALEPCAARCGHICCESCSIYFVKYYSYW